MVHDDTIYPQAVGFSLMQFVLISVWKMLKLVVVTMFVGRLRCVKVTTFYPGRAGLGGWGVACSTLTWPLPGPRRAAPNQPPASQDFSRVREFFHVTLRQPQAARMLGPNQVKLPSLENKTPHCLHEKDVSIGVYKRRIFYTNYWSYYIWDSRSLSY